jgi:serine protease Do
MANRMAGLLTALLALSLVGVKAEMIRLKDNAAVIGKVLAEKKDQLIVDLGFTVLVVPRSQIVSVQTAEDAPRPARSADPRRNQTAPPAKPAPGKPPAAEPAASPAGTSALFVAGSGSAPERSVRELVNQLGEAVVQVRTPGGLGSGFIINDAGYLITNFHVIEGETQISVEVYAQRSGQLERKTYRQVRIVAINKFADLALLKIEDPGAPRFARVPLGQTDTLAVGERVFAIGSPMGLERTVTEGILSTKTRAMQGELYLQTTAQINPGNSGGPLFNLQGEVVGVTNMKLTFGEGLGFAIPVEQVRYFLQHRDAFAYDNDNPFNAYRYLEPPRRLQRVEAAQP